jgi:hypothetical protein
VVHLAIVLSVFLLCMACGSFGNSINCLSSIRSLWFICPLYYLSFFYSYLVIHLAIALSVFFCSWLVIHLAIVLSVFLLFMTCGSFGYCIICLSSIHGLWFNRQLYYLSFFCAWLVVHLAIALSVFFCSWLVVHLAIVLSVFLLFMTCGSFGHCIICRSSIHDLCFIWPLYYLSFFYSWLVVHLAIVLSVFLLCMPCGSFGNWIIYLFSIHGLWFI